MKKGLKCSGRCCALKFGMPDRLQQMSKSKKIIFVASVDWAFMSHRLPLALAVRDKGFEVLVYAVQEGKLKEKIESYGFTFRPLPTTRSGTNLLRELNVVRFLYKEYRREKPLIVHQITVKPVTYGSLACRFLKIPLVVNALTGLGFLFINKDRNRIKYNIIKKIFDFGFKNRKMHFILQNHDDMKMVLKFKHVSQDRVHLIKGSGVDLQEFEFQPGPSGDVIQILFLARMLWDKGLKEFVTAAERLKKVYGDKVRFVLAGGADYGNKAGVPREVLEQWNREGNVTWIDHQKDVKKHITESHIVCLPSYREGLPKALIEACAIGRPIVTTDVPGCREVVEHGVNGFLVPLYDDIELSERLSQLINNESLRNQMGVAGRIKAESLI